MGMPLLALQNAGSYTDIVQAPIGTGADKDLVDTDPGQLLGQSRIVNGMGFGYGRLQLGGINLNRTFIAGVRVRIASDISFASFLLANVALLDRI